MGNYTFQQLEQLWIDAGGNATAAAMAAAIALAESGGNPNASNSNGDGSTDRGLWQINSIHGSQSTFDPQANARAAVQISGNGSSWRPWCVAWSDGKCGGTYLGDGAPYKKYANGVSQGLGVVGGDAVGNVNDASLLGPLSPEKWAEVFLRPIAVWGLYGFVSIAGLILIGIGLFFLAYNAPPTKTLREIVTGLAKNYVKGQLGVAGKNVADKLPQVKRTSKPAPGTKPDNPGADKDYTGTKGKGKGLDAQKAVEKTVAKQKRTTKPGGKPVAKKDDKT